MVTLQNHSHISIQILTKNSVSGSCMNKKLYSGIETIFLVTEGQNYYISSSLVKEVFTHGGSVEEFVPKVVHKYMKENCMVLPSCVTYTLFHKYIHNIPSLQ